MLKILPVSFFFSKIFRYLGNQSNITALMFSSAIIRSVTLLLLLAGAVLVNAAEPGHWSNSPDHSIHLDVPSTSLPHSDHMEMSGKKAAVVVYWSLDSAGRFRAEKGLVFPMLRRIPNNTHASLMYRNTVDFPAQLSVDTRPLKLKAKSMEISGMIGVESVENSATPRISLSTVIFPSMEREAVWEKYTARNIGAKVLTLYVPDLSQKIVTPADKGVQGSYVIYTHSIGAGAYTLQPGDSVNFALEITAYPLDKGPVAEASAADELAARKAFLAEIDGSLILETPNPAIDSEFRHAKIRASESICKTKNGYLHAPGGESYYAAIWANDQAEYVNPFFPFLGYPVGNESAMTSYLMFAGFMNPDYNPIPSSIIAEGEDRWNGAGDRGDAAMIAYGAARYAMELGDKAQARHLWPLIEWCLEYCRRKVNAQGVVASDSDELEGRFPSGDANLCTSSLYYDALVSAAHLGRELGVSSRQLKTYRRQARDLRAAIERHFGAEMKGFHTYRYYDGNTNLRSWICIPLVAGIYDRAEGTVDALFDSDLYSRDGLLTAEGSSTFWDRSTLYALRGALQAGYPDKVLPILSYYSRRRLLGDHVPYPIEAWPEGNQHHLSAESGLYCRIITEGLFGIRPTGLHSFDLTPQLPADWDHASLRHIKAFGHDFDITLRRLPSGKAQVKISGENIRQRTCTLNPGATISINL